MSGSSNVIRLAELQCREAPSEVEREAEEILKDLEGLGDEPDLVEIERLTAELAHTLGKEKRLRAEMGRERFVRMLTGKVSAPARLFDSALRDAGAIFIGGAETEQGRLLTFEDPEPWPDPVDGTELLEELRTAFRRFVVLDESGLAVLALWVVHTYTFDAAWITPRLAVTSPEKRCGKTLVLTLLRHVVAKPLLSANASPAAIFRVVESVRPTLLIDEADTFLRGKDELRGILNSGHQQDGSVLRTVGEDHEPRAFSTFAPVAIAMIGQLPDTLADRAIAIRMARKRSSERVERLRLDRPGPFNELRRRVLRWATDVRERLARADPEVPGELHDRAADNWRPLLAIAEAAGGEWPALARRAAAETSSSNEEDQSARIQLLDDMRSMFERRGADKLFSRTIVEELVGMEERPWPEWKAGKPLTTRQLARLLKPFGIQPREVRIGTETSRGYRRAAFEEAFGRYLTDPIQNKRNSPLESETYARSGSETPMGDVSPSPEPLEPTKQGNVSDVSDRKEDEGQGPREVWKL